MTTDALIQLIRETKLDQVRAQLTKLKEKRSMDYTVIEFFFLQCNGKDGFEELREAQKKNPYHPVGPQIHSGR